ncbi:hypothetical protein BK121_26755 [Paenibacillus odorifer]|uniref:hypothetical protein n=1 Tax=Paenibacillus TaxID=44249 RepID=UPI00096E9C17|nr:hypothetical protein [Paenibacillus odorifer]OMC63533.1 hypothetical protein BK121_26755 [Paenibacillus odorifer]
MDFFLKLLLSSTLIFAINFVFKTLTSSKFDKLFVPKHQKALQTLCIFILLIVLFIIYGMILGALYFQVKSYKYTEAVSGILAVFYLIGLIIVSIVCLMKYFKEKKSGLPYNISEKKVLRLIFVVVFLNIVIYSMVLSDTFFTSGKTKVEFAGDILYCIVQFFVLTCVLVKAMTYLLGYMKRHWGYVVSPTPEDVDKRYLHVLYSLSPTQLVLSEDNENLHYPTNVYLFDVTKQSYIHFERVLIMKK